MNRILHAETHNAGATNIRRSPAFSTPVLICGFPHSGTRLLVTILQTMGVFVPIDGDVGEWRYAKRLNKAMLPDQFDVHAIAGFSGSLASSVIDPADLALRLAELGYSGKSPWGFKDTRSTVTAEAWLASFPGLRIVTVLRNPLDALGTLPAFSKYADEAAGWVRPQEQLEIWAKRWRVWTEKIRQTMSTASLSCELRHEAMCADPIGTAHLIARSLGLSHDFDSDALGRLAVRDWTVGIYRDWIEAGDLTEEQLAPVRSLAKDFGFELHSFEGKRQDKEGRLDGLVSETSRNPTNPASAEPLARELLKRGKIEEAAKVIQRMLEMSTDDLVAIRVVIPVVHKLVKFANFHGSAHGSGARAALSSIFEHPRFVSLAHRFPDMVQHVVSLADKTGLTKSSLSPGPSGLDGTVNRREGH